MGDTLETAALARALWGILSRGEEESLALLSAVSPSTLRRQLAGRARLLVDVLGTNLARLPRETALDVVEQWLDAQRARVRPRVADARQLVLYPPEPISGGSGPAK